MKNLDYVKRNYEQLREELYKISTSVGTKPPTLVSVTKSGTDEELIALAEAGNCDFGENRPSEVQRRGELLRNSGFSPRMHEIGTLQRNKIKLIADSVYMIHSLDSQRLAKDIARHAEARGIRIPVLIEVNSAKEEQKSGVMPEATEELIAEIKGMPQLMLRGLMTMGPVCDEPEQIRPYFRLTRNLFDKYISHFEGEPVLSMGMSDSYRVALFEGSTLVRVGRRLFINNN